MDNYVLLVVEQIGIASAALSGFFFGARKECDYLGVFLAAFLTALGGGIIRDVLVHREVYSFTNFMPMTIVIAVFVGSILLKLHKLSDEMEKTFIFIFSDALGVVSFAIVGSMVALNFDYNIYGVILVAFANGVGGGILRDVLLNEIPWFLRTGFYGTVSMGVGLGYFILDKFDFANPVSVTILLAIGLIFRMVAHYKNWQLPNFK